MFTQRVLIEVSDRSQTAVGFCAWTAQKIEWRRREINTEKRSEREMADTVQRLLERSVAELEDLQVRGIFDREEIRSIVKARTDYEYRLQARAPDKLDYLRYAKYEYNLTAEAQAPHEDGRRGRHGVREGEEGEEGAGAGRRLCHV